MSSTLNSTNPTPTNTVNPGDLVIYANPVIPANQVNPPVPNPTPEPAGNVPGSGANINLTGTQGKLDRGWINNPYNTADSNQPAAGNLASILESLVYIIWHN